MKSLTKDELTRLLEVARKYSERDGLMLSVTFSHGLRVSETIALDKRNIVGDYLITNRLKGSKRTTQPLLDNERSSLQHLARTCEGKFFPMSRSTFWRKMQAYGKEAGIPQFKAHPHALKHSCGRLGFMGGMSVPELVSYLGHVNPANSLIYAQAGEPEASAAFAKAIQGQGFQGQRARVRALSAKAGL